MLYKKEFFILLCIVAITAIVTALVKVPLWVIGALLGVFIFAAFIGLIIDNGAKINRRLSHYLVIIGTIGAFLMAATYSIVIRIKG